MNLTNGSEVLNILKYQNLPLIVLLKTFVHSQMTENNLIFSHINTTSSSTATTILH